MNKIECGHDQEHEELVKRAKANLPKTEAVEKICNIFRVLSEPSRLKIVWALREGEMCVYHIVNACDGNQSAVSHQLRVLKDNGIIKSRREGQNILYSIADEHILEILDMSEKHTDCHF